MILGRIFGTDGVRGIANEKLDVELALAISRAAGMIIKAEGVARPKILVGRDTRLSGEMLQCAVAAGLSSVGCDVELKIGKFRNNNFFFVVTVGIHALACCFTCGNLSRSNNNNVESAFHKIVDIGNLLVAIVFGRTDLNLGIFIIHYFAVYLFIHLCAPVVLATLRHPYSIHFIICTRTKKRTN